VSPRETQEQEEALQGNPNWPHGTRGMYVAQTLFAIIIVIAILSSLIGGLRSLKHQHSSFIYYHSSLSRHLIAPHAGRFFI